SQLFEVIVNSLIKMTWICNFCQRTFTTKTSHTNHVKRCLQSVAESSEELSLEVMMIDSLDSLESERLNNEDNFETNTNLPDNCVTLRNNENMQEFFYNNTGQEVSLENIPNYFWSLP
ncbi:1467_t:CDS:2, partial [Dentiscutata erythropus]